MGDFCIRRGTAWERSCKATATETVGTVGTSGRTVEAHRSRRVGRTDKVVLSATDVFSCEGRRKQAQLNRVETCGGSAGAGGSAEQFGCVDDTTRVLEVVAVAASCCFGGDVDHIRAGLDGQLPVVSGRSVTVSVFVNDGDLDFLAQSILDDHDKAVGPGIIGGLAGLTKERTVGGVIGIQCHTKDPEGSASIHEGRKDTASCTRVETTAIGAFPAVDGATHGSNACCGGSCDVGRHFGFEFGEDLQRELRRVLAVSDGYFDGHVGGDGLCGYTRKLDFKLAEFFQGHP